MNCFTLRHLAINVCMCIMYVFSIILYMCMYVCMCSVHYNNYCHITYSVLQQIPFFFPANLLVYLNGSTASTVTNRALIAVSGLIPEEEYQQMLREKHFNYTTPQEFHGFNVDPFPFWSSEPLTYASTMLALTQYRALLGGK